LGLFSEGGARDSLQKLETSGIGIDIMGGEALRDLIVSFPDYNKPLGRNAPQAVNMFRCGGVIEGKELCKNKNNAKPSDEMVWCSPHGGSDCDVPIKNAVRNAKYHAGESCSINEERYQTPWNDGWKMHRLKGRLLGFHMIQMLHLAAIELDLFERQHPELQISDILDVLREEEEVEEFLFSKTRPSRFNDEGSTNLLKSWNALKQKNAFCLNAQVASSVPRTKNLPKFELEPPRGSLCEDFLPFKNVYFRVMEEDGWVWLDPLAQLHEVLAEKGSVALGLCFKHCYGNQCGNQGVGEVKINWNRVVIRVNGELVSGLKKVGGCYILQGEQGVLWNNKAIGSGMKIQNHGDDALLVSSAFILY